MANLIPQESELPRSEAEYKEKVSHRRAGGEQGGSAGGRAPRRCRGGEHGGSQRGRRAYRGGATAAGHSDHGGRTPADLETAQTVGIWITFSIDGEWATAL